MLVLKIALGCISVMLIAYALIVSLFAASNPEVTTKELKIHRRSLIIGLILAAIDIVLIAFT